MTMNLTGSGQALDNSEPTILSEFKATREDIGVLRNSAKHKTMKPHTGSSYNVINYNRLRAYVVNPGVPTAQSQELADDLTTYTPNEVSVKVSVAGAALRRSGDASLAKEIGHEMAIAYDRTEEMEGASQFAALSSAVGSAGTACSPGALLAMATRLGYGNSRAIPEAPPKPWNYILHPIHQAVVAGRLVPYSDVPTGTNDYDGTSANAFTVGAGRTSFGDDLIKRGVGALGMINGSAFKVTPYLIPDSSDDVSGALISEDGLYYISEVSYKVDPKPLERDGKEYVGWGAYAFGLYKLATYGVEGLFDATELT
ncbi:MAG: hypothetical protein AB7E70_20170 [Hyphomicrobiaceae bacterium]